MRRGTHSCLQCRHRKVRCSYPSPEASVCVQCAKRKTTCIPQGAIIQTVRNPQPVGNSDHAPFFKALHQLHQRVFVAVGGGSRGTPDSSHQASSSAAISEPEIVKSNYAPVMKLLNHELIRQGTEALHSPANPQEPDIEPRSRPEGQHYPMEPLKHASVLQAMCQAIPADREVAEIFATRSRWWSTKRRSFGLAWGDGGDRTLTHFATHAVLSENPSLLGNLLLCFALSTGDFGRYLVPVERWILSDALHCSTVYDFQCLMGLGVCFLSDMQPRRAWMVYRNANALLQLNGIHRSQQRSQSLDLIFWELFGADRWVSMLIGLPYSIPDTLCYLPILPIDRSDPCTFHHRHMILLSGRVIDCLQSPSGLSRSAIIKVDEDINRVTAQLPPNYVDMTHIAACPEPDERIARLYRVAELNQLKTLLYLPLFLQQCDPGQHQQPEDPLAHYGRTACVGSARSLLEAYLALYDIDPAAAAVDNCMKLTSFTAFSAAVVLFLNILAQAHSNTEGVADWSSVLGADMASIYRTASAFEASSEGRPSSLCGQCQTALTDLISASQTLGRGESRQIRVPYFGVVKMVRSENRDSVTSNDQPVDTELQQSPPLFRDPVRTTILAAGDDTELFPALTVSDDLFFSYYGPWGCDNQVSPPLLSGFTEAGGDPLTLGFTPFSPALDFST